MEAVLKVEINDDKTKLKAIKKVCDISPGIVSISVDMKDKKMTVAGDIDAVTIENKLNKLFGTKLFLLGPYEPKKDEERNKEKKEEEERIAVLEVNIDAKTKQTKQKAMKIVCDNSGIGSIDMDMKDMKMTVTGDRDINPVTIVNKLRGERYGTKLLSFGPCKPKKEEERKRREEEQERKRKEERKRREEEQERKRREEERQKRKEEEKKRKEEEERQRKRKEEERKKN